jgi:hypothetical protein
MVLDHIAEVEAALTPSHEQNPSDAMAILLERLTCVGRETAVVLTREVLCSDFRDGRSVAAFAEPLYQRPTASRPGDQ